MALELENFTSPDDSGLTMDSFQSAPTNGVPVSRVNASQIAATSAILTGTQQSDFHIAREQLLDPNSRKEFITTQEGFAEAVRRDAQNVVPEIASDPNIPLEERIQLVEGSYVPRNPGLPDASPLDLLAEEAAIEGSGLETVPQEQFRFSFVDEIQEANNSKQRIASAINALRFESDQGMTANLVDVAEMVVPFAEWIHINNLLKDVSQDSSEAILLGTQKDELYNTVNSMSSQDREAFSMAMIGLVKSHDTMILPDGNALATIDTLENMLLGSSYGDVEKWFDNVISVVDVLGLVGSAKAAVKLGARARAIPTTQTIPPSQIPNVPVEQDMLSLADAVDSPLDDLAQLMGEGQETQSLARSHATITGVSPTSPYEIIKNVNPEMARRMDESSLLDETGEAAEALFGTSRTEAAARTRLPEPQLEGQSIPNKPSISDPVARSNRNGPSNAEPDSVRANRVNSGQVHVSRVEETRAAENVRTGLLRQSDEVAVSTNPKGGHTFVVHYRPKDSAFTSYDDAVVSTELQFRENGVTNEEITVSRLKGEEWVPVTREEAATLPEGTPLTAVIKQDYHFDPADLDEWEVLSTGNFVSKILDSTSARKLSPSRLGQGSLAQHIFDAASLVDKRIVNAASVAVDKSFNLRSMYSNLARDFTDIYSALGKDRRQKMSDYINEANRDGVAWSDTDLNLRGFTEAEKNALAVWRRTNDVLWHAVNADLVKSLRGRGYASVVHKGSDTTLIGRPMKRGSVASTRPYYLPGKTGADSVKTMSAKELDELYENGGEIVKLDEPLEVEGTWVDSVVSRNTVDGAYTRKLTDNQKVLSYREGYYPLSYNANYFILKRIKTKDGDVVKVVGTAENKVDSDNIVSGLTRDDPDSVYEYRKDSRFNEYKDESIMGDDGWNLAVSSGMSSQRIRGQRLTNYSVGVNGKQGDNLVDPMEALSRQINSLSSRVPMREYFDSVKTRWMKNYGVHLDLPINRVTGEPDFPNSVGAIEGKSGVSNSLVTAARTNFNYISSLENGYISIADEASRAVANIVANKLADWGYGKGEAMALRASEMSPVNASKQAAFKMLLAAHPLRQAFIQRAQIITNAVIDPEYMLTFKWLRDLVDVRQGLRDREVALKQGVSYVNKDPEMQSMVEDLADAGILESVDAHNFVRQDAFRLADMTVAQRTGRKIMAPLNFAQKWGFDIAEQDNLIAAWLVQRRQAVKRGEDTSDPRVRDKIIGDTRAFTLNMNRAGEMPYAKNSFGLGTQFLSFMHKAFLQPLSNKSLTVSQRVQLSTFNTVLYGSEAALVGLAVNEVWKGVTDGESNKHRELFENGLLHVTLNEVASMATGEDQRLDWGDLAPTEIYNVGNRVESLLQSGFFKIIAESPSGSLLFGGNPRLTNIFNTTVRLFVPAQDYEDPELNTTLYDVGSAALNAFSGMSASFRTVYALRMGEKMSSNGRISDEQVTKFEAMMSAFGIQTEDEVDSRSTLEAIYGSGNNDYVRSDARIWYNEVRAQLSRRNISIEEREFQIRVAQEAWRVFGDSRPAVHEEVMSLAKRDAQDNNLGLFNIILDLTDSVTEDELQGIVNEMPNSEYKNSAQLLLDSRRQP